MKKAKIVSVFVAVALLICALTSCGSTPESAIEKADKALTKAPYKVELDMEFNCEDATYGSILEGMATDMDMYVDGDNFAMELGLMGVTMNITYVGDTAYMRMSAYGETVKQKATLTEEQRNEFLENNGASLGVDIVDFSDVSMTRNDDGETVISCNSISEESLNDLIESTLGNYESAELNVFAKDVAMTVVIDSGKYETVTMTLMYVFEIDGQSIEVDAVLELDYDYDDARSVSAPSDADQYTEGNYEDIFGV